MIASVCKFIVAGKRDEFEDWNFSALPRAGDRASWPVRGDWVVIAVEWRHKIGTRYLQPFITLERAP